MIRNKQSVRSLIAFLVTWAFVVLTVTGIVLYIVPQGRIAYWTYWSLGGLGKEEWAWVHMMFGGIFIVTGVLHLYFNWKPFKKYLAERIKGRLNLSRELVASLLITAVVIVLSVFNLPPASWVIALNENIKAGWVTDPAHEPPFGHAEELSLNGIAKRMRLDLGAAARALKRRQIRFEPEDTLDTIARNNHTTPMVIYGYISQYKEQPTHSREKSSTPEDIEAVFAGTGLGQRSIAGLCEAAAVEIEACLLRLRAADIQTTGQQRVREVASAHQLNPIDLMKLILLPASKP